MSRKLRHSRSQRSRPSVHAPDDTANTAPSQDDAPLKLPPRRKKFPSSLQKVNKWYYNFLFVLFLCLVGFLFWYGNKFSP
ncbi:hypothetical protein [Paenibacillus soyae]|uniref:Uncharacterized protein n=1 Tax=Paenibacillus soyae TaxID=2969249 RepID=A0A9X2S9S3_9BACL|nr:hypothetical protein [Paenibacillus soyae]MCR2803047.1 hypothetical protein [Paenibacillus soyae]